MLAARDQQRRDSSEHLAKQPPVQMSLGQQQPVVAGVLEQPSTFTSRCCKLVIDQASMLFGSVPGNVTVQVAESACSTWIVSALVEQPKTY